MEANLDYNTNIEIPGKPSILKPEGAMKRNTSLAAKGALAHRLHRRTACNAAPPAKSKMAARGPQNGGRGLERCQLSRFLGILSNFR